MTCTGSTPIGSHWEVENVTSHLTTENEDPHWNIHGFTTESSLQLTCIWPRDERKFTQSHNLYKMQSISTTENSTATRFHAGKDSVWLSYLQEALITGNAGNDIACLSFKEALSSYGSSKQESFIQVRDFWHVPSVNILLTPLDIFILCLWFPLYTSSRKKHHMPRYRMISFH